MDFCFDYMQFFSLLLNYRLTEFYSKYLPRFALLFCYLFHLQSIYPFWHNFPHVVVVCLLPLVIGNLSNTSVAEHRKGCWTQPCIVNVVDCRDFDLCYVCDKLEVIILWKILPYGARNPRMKCKYTWCDATLREMIDLLCPWCLFTYLKH
jgi:hypothetical protein